MEAQIQRMAQELAEYKAESTELRNQDGIIKRLEERIRFLEASSKEKVDRLGKENSSPGNPIWKGKSKQEAYDIWMYFHNTS